jgi:hypothetical protein
VRTLDSLYAQYLRERQGVESIWNQNGFIAYKCAGDECFIAELFVEPEARRSGACRELVERVMSVARASGRKVLTGNIHIKDPGHDQTLQAAYALGFKVIGAESGILFISKNVMEEK